MYKLVCLKKIIRPDVVGIWIYGSPGTGKTHRSRELGGESYYIKAQNKWWDGYQQEKTVILDDFDKAGSALAHHLKLWTDRWDKTGEVKFGTIPLNYE